jgi:hypothetical protein
MTNHVHLLIREEKETISQIMKRIGTRYVQFFNWKYERVGYLFQDRFKSEAVDSDSYFLTLLRYIHQNPQKAGMVKHGADYVWSSYRDYVGKCGVTDVEFALELLQGEDFGAFISESGDEECLDFEEKSQRFSDDELEKAIVEQYNMQPAQIKELAKNRRNKILKDILNMRGITIRQLARVTGISNKIIWKSKKET